MLRTIHDVAEQLYVEPEQRTEFARRMFRDGRVFEFEVRVYRKDGSVIWVSVNARAVRDGSGEIVGFEGTLEDITERKRAEEDLRRSLDRLVALHEAGHLLGSTLEPEEIATRLLEIMRRISGLTAAVISLRDAGQLRIWRSIGLENLKPEIRYTPEVREAQEAVLENEAPRSFPVGARRDREDESVVGLFLPLRVRERAVGVLEVYGPKALAENDVVEILESSRTPGSTASSPIPRRGCRSWSERFSSPRRRSGAGSPTMSTTGSRRWLPPPTSTCRPLHSTIRPSPKKVARS
jgi:hypothetical protein